MLLTRKINYYLITHIRFPNVHVTSTYCPRHFQCLWDAEIKRFQERIVEKENNNVSTYIFSQRICLLPKCICVNKLRTINSTEEMGTFQERIVNT